MLNDAHISAGLMDLFCMSTSTPARTQRVEPFGVGPQEGSKEVEEEKVLFPFPSPSLNPPSFFPPYAPSTLTSNHLTDL